LDECTNRSMLLELIGTKFHELPRRFRIILTGRPELDISTIMNRFAEVHDLSHQRDQVLDDISKYFTHRLVNIAEKHDFKDKWPSQQDIDQLIELSSGLFIWAATACDFIGKPTALNPRDQLKAVLSNRVHGIDALYTLALQKALDWEDPKSQQAFSVFMGVVMEAKVPLSANTVDALARRYGKDLAISATQLLSHLRSLLDGVGSPNGTINILHLSFRDFLTDASRSQNLFHIDKAFHNANIALACFELMNEYLEPDICKLVDDTVLIENISDTVIREHISDELQYAVRFGLDHLLEVSITNADHALAVAVKEFLNKHLLEWFEALSLLRCFEVADELKKVETWLENARSLDGYVD